MSDLHEASFYEPLPKEHVWCKLCPHDCRIPEGARGACGVRYNHAGKLVVFI
jgi:pyruvate formate lyase activating enzyme